MLFGLVARMWTWYGERVRQARITELAYVRHDIGVHNELARAYHFPRRTDVFDREIDFRRLLAKKDRLECSLGEHVPSDSELQRLVA